jgi:DNA helicase-2/ATP-dependent DNA helicase PcrA
LPHPIVDEELELLERVHAVLEAAPRHPTPSEAPIVQDLERIREQLVSGRESKDETALTEQWHRQSALLRQLRESRDAPEVDPRSPYFAHLRLREDDRERDLCLGRATRIESGVRIVDWRNAPVSRVFYRYQQGDDYEEEFAGKLREGQVVARRTVRIHDGGLDRVEAPEGTFGIDPSVEGGWRKLAVRVARLGGGEGSALRAHAVDAGATRRLGTDLDGDRRRADKRLPEITSLIDPTQFDLITRPSVGYLAIRGNAGSGKTTVALHRIAYLAYEEPEVDSGQTLFVVFSAALARYVGHVLPSLGVRRVRITTYRDWAREQRRRLFPKLPSEERLDAPAIVQRLKLHPALAEALARHVAETPGPANVDQAIDDWTSVSTRDALIRQCCDDLAPGTVSNAEIEQFCEWNRRRREELFGWLAREPEIQAGLEPEDDALLLRAWQLRIGPLPDRGNRPLRYRHLAIDEVQDFAPLEVRTLIECLDEHRSLTLAGDTQQSLLEHSGFTSWSGFLAHLGIPGEALETLRVSYRSSREIVEFASAVLGDLREDDGRLEVPRTGPPVELFRFTDRGACVAFLADALRELVAEEPLASVAILTPSPESSEAYHLGLASVGLQKLHRVERQDFSFTPGIEISEIEQAKGLEFDYVILADTSADRFPDRDGARRLLHVGATRAVHQLWLTCVGTPSPLIGLPES